MARYFMLSVSTRENLDICRRYALGGLSNSTLGVWAYVDIKLDDFISFLYGAKAYDLYRVKSKYAIKGAQNLGPWPAITFKESGRSYYFPFRLELEPVRTFEESLVRTEFAYIAENLLLRGGYKKSHFQADQTTLQVASQLGKPSDAPKERFHYKADLFEPVFVRGKSTSNPPESYPFNELILQCLVKDYLSRAETLKVVAEIFPELSGRSLEVLGERALPRGHVDILVKETVPIGSSDKIVVEVKNRAAKFEDLIQLDEYKRELGKECLGALLISRKFSEKILTKAKELNIRIASFSLDWSYPEKATYDELQRFLKISLFNVG